MPSILSERVAALVKAASAVVGRLDLQAVLENTVVLARDLTGARYAALGVIGSHGTLVDFLHVGVGEDQASSIGAPPSGKGVLGTLIHRAETIRVDDVHTHPDFAGYPHHHPEMTSFLGVPVRAGERIFGNLYLADKPGGFTEDDEVLVEALAAIAGGAVATARLHQRLTRLALVEDRERIARDLHDAVIQDLFAVGLELQGLSLTVDDPRVATKLADAVERLDEAIGSLRSFIFDLRSLANALLDPARTITDLVTRLVRPAGMTAEVSVADLGEVSPARFHDLLQMVREATSNAARHAGTDRVEVHVRREDDLLVAEVVDQGRGFDPETVERGMGLDNLWERAQEIGGEVRIDSRPGAGTRVTVRLPA